MMVAALAVALAVASGESAGGIPRLNLRLAKTSLNLGCAIGLGSLAFG